MARLNVYAGLLLLLTVFVSSGNCVPSYVVCPDPDPLDRTVFFPHESNCTEFYRCDHGSPLQQYCPSGLHWNSKLDTCDFPWDAGCTSEGGSGGGEGGGEGGSGGSGGGSGGEGGSGGGECGGNGGGSGGGSCPAGTTPTCPDPDPEYSVFFPHENDCHYFYHCSNGVAYCKVCPSGLHWNTELDTCDWPWQAGCSSGGGGGSGGSGGGSGGSGGGSSGGCPVPQPAFNVYFPNPSDCTQFYQCSHGVAYLQQCPAGLNFNPTLNVCDYPENAGCSGGSDGSAGEGSGGDAGGSGSGGEGAGSESEVPKTSCPDAESPVCPITNPDVSVYFPHPTDAHWFFHCSYGVAYCKVCPAGLRWSQEKEQCDY